MDLSIEGGSDRGVYSVFCHTDFRILKMEAIYSAEKLRTRLRVVITEKTGAMEI